MTPIFLMDNLEEFIKEKTKDILLEVKDRSGSNEPVRRAADVYKFGLPEADDAVQRVPYILLKILTGTDSKKENEPPESIVKVRIIFAVYSKNEQDGTLSLLNLILKVRSELEKTGIIAKKYALQMPLEYIVYQDTTPPYYLGEMITSWSVPAITREVEEFLW